jgi:alpha-tubulin suppressor-like RCC1 family protein
MGFSILDGQLGQNNRIPRSSPVQIPGTTWSALSAGGSFSLATKTDNTLWSWGYNNNGQLGQNSTNIFHHQFKYQELHGVL